MKAEGGIRSGACRPSVSSFILPPSAFLSLDYEVDELFRDVELLDERFAVDPGGYAGLRAGGREDRALVGVGGDGDLAAQLAVDLHGQLERRLDQLGRVDWRPGVAGERFGVPEPLPDLLGDVRRERREQQREPLGEPLRD